jgi:hypothetical protein
MSDKVSAFGLHVRSEVPLPLDGDDPTDADGNVDVVEGGVHFPPGQDGDVASREGDVFLRVDGVGAFRIRTDSVVVDRDDGVADGTLTAAILGRVLAVLLYRRDYLVMHGSGAAVDGSGAAFVGFKGSGKSSLAAGLYTRGHAPVTDDIVVMRPGDRPSLVPSFPRMKLDERTLATLGLIDGARETDRKQWYAVDDRFERNPVPLDTVFVLEERDIDGPTVDALEPATAMERLLRHSASAELVEATETEERHFRECAQVADAADVKRLYRPDDLSQLPELARTVENALE